MTDVKSAYDFLVPCGYGTRYITVEELIHLYFAGCEPEAGDRHLDFIIAHRGLYGIGGGVRPCPDPVSPASAACKSFHQKQRFHDGTVWWMAFDYVRRNPDRTKPHLTLRTGDLPVQGSKEAAIVGIHANVGVPGEKGWEPWHGQPYPFDGFDRWDADGRPRPTTHSPQPKPPLPPLSWKVHTVLKNLNTIAPYVRFFDSRPFGGPFTAGQYDVGVPKEVPNSATGVHATVKIIGDKVTGYATVWPGDYPAPGTSNLDFNPGDEVNADIHVPIVTYPSGLRSFKIFISADAGIVVDLLGFYTDQL
jgi:hypothetical protein